MQVLWRATKQVGTKGRGEKQWVHEGTVGTEDTVRRALRGVVPDEEAGSVGLCGEDEGR